MRVPFHTRGEDDVKLFLASRLSRSCLLLAIVTATACVTAAPAPAPRPVPVVAAGPAPRQVWVNRVQRQFPREEYLVGFGAGSTPELAEAGARIETAAAIRSEITANLHTIQSEQTVGGKTTHGGAVSEEVARKVATDAGAVIHVRPELTTSIEGNYEAVAVANRQELDGKYAQDADRILGQLTIAWDQATKQEHGPLEAVVNAMCEARGYEGRLDQLDNERRLVAGHAAWTVEAKARRHQMDALRARLHSTKVSVVRADDAPGIAEAILKTLAKAGFVADIVKKPDCSTGGLMLQVAVQQTCSNSMLGPRCESSLVVNGNRCDANEQLFVEASNTGVAVNASDQTQAARAAFRKIDVPKFVEGVASRVTRSIDGECP
jgi:hypothetical protein